MDNQEAIETIKLALSQIEWEYPMDYAVAFDMAISALESQEWVPVSQRLPDIGEEVLVTYSIDRRKKRFVYTATWSGEEWLSVWDEFRDMRHTITYHAWKPLPEPYKEE